MYGGDPATMAALRQRALADPAGFLALAQRPCMEKYDLEGPVYKRDHLPAGTDPALKPYRCLLFTSGEEAIGSL